MDKQTRKANFKKLQPTASTQPRSTRSTKTAAASLTLSNYFSTPEKVSHANTDTLQTSPQHKYNANNLDPQEEQEEPQNKKKRVSDDFEKPAAKPKKAPKLKSSAPRRGRSKKQPTISAFLRNEQLFSEVTAQHCIADNFSPDEIELALALSKSEVEKKGKLCLHQTLEDNEEMVELVGDNGTEEATTENIRLKLQKYGFRTAAKEDYNVLSTAIMPLGKRGKRHKWANKFTPLTLRNPEMQLKKMQNKVSVLLAQQRTTRELNAEERKNLPYETKSTLLKIYQASAENTIIKEPCEKPLNLNSYYVTELFEVLKTPAGHLLKSWAAIPGRDLSPKSPSIQARKRKKQLENVYRELELHFADKPIEAETCVETDIFGSLEVEPSQQESQNEQGGFSAHTKLLIEKLSRPIKCDSLTDISAINCIPYQEEPHKEAKLSDTSKENINPSTQSGLSLPSQATRCTSPDIFADSEDEEMGTINSEPVEINKLSLKVCKDNTGIEDRDNLTDITSYEVFSSDEDLKTVISDMAEKTEKEIDLKSSDGFIDLTEDGSSPAYVMDETEKSTLKYCALLAQDSRFVEAKKSNEDIFFTLNSPKNRNIASATSENDHTEANSLHSKYCRNPISDASVELLSDNSEDEKDPTNIGFIAASPLKSITGSTSSSSIEAPNNCKYVPKSMDKLLLDLLCDNYSEDKDSNDSLSLINQKIHASQCQDLPSSISECFSKPNRNSFMDLSDNTFNGKPNKNSSKELYNDFLNKSDDIPKSPTKFKRNSFLDLLCDSSLDEKDNTKTFTVSGSLKSIQNLSSSSECLGERSPKTTKNNLKSSRRWLMDLDDDFPNGEDKINAVSPKLRRSMKYKKATKSATENWYNEAGICNNFKESSFADPLSDDSLNGQKIKAINQVAHSSKEIHRSALKIRRKLDLLNDDGLVKNDHLNTSNTPTNPFNSNDGFMSRSASKDFHEKKIIKNKNFNHSRDSLVDHLSNDSLNENDDSLLLTSSSKTINSSKEFHSSSTNQNQKLILDNLKYDRVVEKDHNITCSNLNKTTYKDFQNEPSNAFSSFKCSPYLFIDPSSDDSQDEKEGVINSMLGRPSTSNSKKLYSSPAKPCRKSVLDFLFDDCVLEQGNNDSNSIPKNKSKSIKRCSSSSTNTTKDTLMSFSKSEQNSFSLTQWNTSPNSKLHKSFSLTQSPKLHQDSNHRPLLSRKSVSFANICESQMESGSTEISIDLTNDRDDEDNDGTFLSDDEINYSIWKARKSIGAETALESPYSSDCSLTLDEPSKKTKKAKPADYQDDFLMSSPTISLKSGNSRSPNKSALSKERAEFGILDAAISQPFTLSQILSSPVKQNEAQETINWTDASFLDAPTDILPKRFSSTRSHKFNELLTAVSKPKEHDSNEVDNGIDEFDRLVHQTKVVSFSAIINKLPSGLDQLLMGDIQMDILPPTPTKQKSPLKTVDLPEQLEVNGNIYAVRVCNTPKPDFTKMPESELLKHLYNYGIKPLKRKQAVKMLEFIYNQTHPFMLAPEEPQTMTSQISLPRSNSLNEGTESSISCAPTQQSVSAKEKSNLELKDAFGDELLRLSAPALCDDFESYVLQTNVTKKTPQPLVPFHIAFHNLLCANVELHLKVVTFEPIDLQQIYLYLKELGYRYDPKEMKSFLDRRCIIFRYDLTDPEKPSNRHTRKKRKKTSEKS